MANVYAQITRLQKAKKDIEEAIEDCGVTVDDTDLISDYAERIRAIPSTVLGGLNASDLPSHNHSSNQITPLTSYSIATASSALTASDSLNAALGKLEYKANLGVTAYDLVNAANNGDTIENLKEILDVLHGIKDTDTIQAIVGKYLPLSGGQMSGNVTWENGTGHSTRLPGHIYRNVYGATNNVYDHYYNSDCTASTFANLRVLNVDSANNRTFKTLCFGGNGTFTWDGNSVVHSKTPSDISTTTGTYKLWASINQQSPKYCDTITYTVTKNSDNSYTKLFNVNASMNVSALSVTNLKVIGGYGIYKTGCNDTTPAIIYTTKFTSTSYHPILKVTTHAGHIFNIGGINNTFGIHGFNKTLAQSASNGLSYGVYFDIQECDGGHAYSVYPHNDSHTLGRYYTYTKSDNTVVNVYNQWGCVYTKKIERRDGTSLYLTSPNGVSLRYNDSDNTSVIFNGEAFKPYNATVTANGVTLGTSSDVWKNVFSAVITAPLIMSPLPQLRLLAGNQATTGLVLTEQAFYPSATETYNLGQSGFKWKNVYAKTFTGDLKYSLQIKLDNGATLNTNNFIFNNSASRTINITPESIRTSRVVNGAKGSGLDAAYYCYQIGTLPASSGSTYDSLHIVGNIGGYEALTKSVVNLMVGRRGGTYFRGTINKSGYENRWTIGVRESDGAVLIITRDTFVCWSLEIFNHQGSITVDNNGKATYNTLSSFTGITILDDSVNVFRTPNTANESGIAYFSSNNSLDSHQNIKVKDNSLRASGGFYEESDERLKTFYDDIEVDFNKLSKIPKKYFTWNDRDCEMQIGTSAQEIEKIYPELVTHGDDGVLNVNYSKLSIIALKAVDVLYTEIKTLKSRLNFLENKIYSYGG